MHKRLLLVLTLGLALCACIKQTGIQFPSNMSRMPIVEASYYDNPLVYAASDTRHPAAQIAESITAQVVVNVDSTN